MAEVREQQANGSLAKRLLFWDFPRASWQYDVVVAVILLFIFLTPREWFHDQPKASSLVLLSPAHGTNRVFIAPELLLDVPETARAQRAAELVRQRTGKSWPVERVEAIKDEAAGELRGFIAYTAR